jgi:gamma-glutamylcyclotransferase (GGCT)/AIG2-like uncharacterized protein YtfP
MKIFMVNKGQLQEINKPIFSTGDVYLIDDERIIYVWIGNACSVDEKTAGAAQARTLDQQRGGAAKIITIDQNQEPAEFLKLINAMGTMKIVEQNIAKTMLKDVFTGDYAQFSEHVNVLYRVSSEEFEEINTMKMVQVPYSKEELDTEDCFVLDLGTKVYVWQGNACNVKEKVKAGQWARQIDAERAGMQNEVIFEEGDDAEFISALEKGEYYKESDAVQLRAESSLEPETEADLETKAIQPEFKSEVRDVTPADIKADIEDLKVASASGAAPGIPGSTDDLLTIEKVEGRRKCPQCGNENKLLIHESIDKGNIILDYPRMYGKKYRCGECGLEWREK